jgi:hypothetical protein
MGLSPDGSIVFVTDRMCKLYGWSQGIVGDRQCGC